MKKRKGRGFRWLVFIIDILLAVWISRSARAQAVSCDRDVPLRPCSEVWNGGMDI